MPPKKKIRITLHREIILEELKKVDTHPTADEIYTMVRRRIPHISLGTVYRNLDMLSECGLIRRLDIAGSQMRFDGITQKHYHVRCVRCGCIEDLPMKVLTEVEKEVYKMCGYEVMDHNLVFTGLCPDCREKEST